MSEPAITVEKLGKRYVIGAGHTDMLSERLQRVATAPVRALRRRARDVPSHMTTPRDTEGELWALRDVSLEIAARRGGRLDRPRTAPARARC